LDLVVTNDCFEKSQPDVIYKIYLAILKQYSFFNAFIATVDALEIYMQQFWHTVTYDLTAKTYFFTLDDEIFEVNADLLCNALRITPKVSDHPFTLPPPEEEIISFIIQLGYTGSLTKGRLQVLTDQELLCFKFYKEWSQNNHISKRLQSYHHVIKIDASLGNQKFTTKGAKDLVFGMPIPMVMLSEKFKTSEDYLNYLAKYMGTQPIKVNGKGFLTKKGVEVVVETNEDDDEEPQLTRRRQTSVVIGRAVHTEKASKQDFILKQRPKGLGEGSSAEPEVPKGPSGRSRSSSSESGDEIEDKSSDEERFEAYDTKKAKAEKAKEENAREEQHVDGQGGNKQAGDVQAEVHVFEPQTKKPATTLIISGLTLSSAEYGNQFINDNPNVSINFEVLKDPAEIEV
ncbi:hypothetical protein Tco_1250803, partial [Tanacetum coccineum]